MTSFNFFAFLKSGDSTESDIISHFHIFLRLFLRIGKTMNNSFDSLHMCFLHDLHRICCRIPRMDNDREDCSLLLTLTAAGTRYADFLYFLFLVPVIVQSRFLPTATTFSFFTCSFSHKKYLHSNLNITRMDSHCPIDKRILLRQLQSGFYSFRILHPILMIFSILFFLHRG